MRAPLILILVLLLQAVLPAPVLAGQSSRAAALRKQAAEHRQEAARIRKIAKDHEAAAAKRRQMAADERTRAAEWRKKGKTEQAGKHERNAKNDDYEAAARQAKADSNNREAVELEATAIAKEAEAKKLEEKDPALTLLAECEATLKRTQKELQDLKIRTQQRHVGQEFMKREKIYGYSIPDTYTFTQAMLDEMAKPFEADILANLRGVVDDRAAFRAGSADSDKIAAMVYRRVYYGIGNLLAGVLALSRVGIEHYVVPIYRQEYQLSQEYAKTKEDLIKSRTVDPQYTRILEALKLKQSYDRKQTFEETVARFRSDKNYLLVFRQEWVDETTRWHDLATKLSTGDDVHRNYAADFRNLLASRFTGANNMGSFGNFVGSYHNFWSVPYEEYEWCKSRPYPDVQFSPSNPSRMCWDDVLRDIKPVLTSGKASGASKVEKP